MSNRIWLATAAAGVLCLVLGAVWFVSVVHTIGGNNGTPKGTSVTVQTIEKSKALDNLMNDSGHLHLDIDDLVGYGGSERLSSGDVQMWSLYDGKYRRMLEYDIKNMEQDLSSVNTDQVRVSDIKTDLGNLHKLLAIADAHHNSLGAKALVYFHRVSEDLNHYLTGSGEHYGVSNVDGSHEVDMFIKSSGE